MELAAAAFSSPPNSCLVSKAPSPAPSSLFQECFHHTHSSESRTQQHLRWPQVETSTSPAKLGSLGSGLRCTSVYAVEHWSKAEATSLCSRARKPPTSIRNQNKTQIMMSFDHNFAISSQESRTTPEAAIFRPSNLTSEILI